MRPYHPSELPSGAALPVASVTSRQRLSAPLTSGTRGVVGVGASEPRMKTDVGPSGQNGVHCPGHGTAFVILARRAAILSLWALLADPPSLAWASAGGFAGAGAGTGVGGVYGDLIVWISFAFLITWAVYASVNRVVLMRKGARCRDLLRMLSSRDASWDEQALSRRARVLFTKVQDAWAARDQDIARDFMSARLYERQVQLTHRMLNDHHRIIMSNVQLSTPLVVGVVTGIDSTEDRVWVRFSARLFDYVLDERSNQVVKGDKRRRRHLQEIWTLMRVGNEWVVDEIDQTPGLSGLAAMRCVNRAGSPSDPVVRRDGVMDR